MRVLSLFSAAAAVVSGQDFLLGAGIADVTGPASEVNLMGYANPGQIAGGIHTRLWSRAFIFGDINTPEDRIVLVPVDMGMGSELVKQRVIERLQEKYGPDLYTYDNVCMWGSHTHSGPAGFLQYVLYDITSWGFVEQTFDAFVDGIYESIVEAHDNLVPGTVAMAEGELEKASINRSPTSYLRNPEEERAMYRTDTENTMTALKMLDQAGGDIGMVNWFGVHATSMKNDNRYLSGDNKGYAQLRMESFMNGDDVRPGKGRFISGFGQGILGDVSPNTDGAKCVDTGLPCDILTSTCNGRNQMCQSNGPGKDMFESTKMIGEYQYQFAKTLYQDAKTPVRGRVQARHKFVNMTNLEIKNPQGGNVTHTCYPAMGYSFAAGTTDGPGMFDFTQGDTSGNPFWDLIGGLLNKPTPEDKECQWPKPILLNIGKVERPYEWSASIVPVQLMKLGNLVIAAPPGEFSVMAGRRVKRMLKDIFGPEVTVVVSGLANSYSSYIVTYEEYQAQRYEAASTLYGPHTHQAYMEIFEELAIAIRDDTTVEPGDPTPDLQDELISLLPGVVLDRTPDGFNYGDVLTDVMPSYRMGQRVEVMFQCGNPRNNLKTEDTFLAVEYRNPSSGRWEVVQTDADWDTIFDFNHPAPVQEPGVSNCKIFWDIGVTTPMVPGTYRIRHFGHSKITLTDLVRPYTGTSSEFQVA